LINLGNLPGIPGVEGQASSLHAINGLEKPRPDDFVDLLVGDGFDIGAQTLIWPIRARSTAQRAGGP